MKKAVHVIPAVVALATKAAAHPAAVQTKCASDLVLTQAARAIRSGGHLLFRLLVEFSG